MKIKLEHSMTWLIIVHQLSYSKKMYQYTDNDDLISQELGSVTAGLLRNAGSFLEGRLVIG